MIDARLCDVLADGMAATDAEAACQLPYGQIAQRRQLHQRRRLADFAQALVDATQPPYREAADRRALMDRSTVACDFDRDLAGDQFHQHFAGEAGVPQFIRQPRQQIADVGVAEIEAGFETAVGPFEIAFEPLPHRLGMDVTHQRALRRAAAGGDLHGFLRRQQEHVADAFEAVLTPVFAIAAARVARTRVETEVEPVIVLQAQHAVRRFEHMEAGELRRHGRHADFRVDGHRRSCVAHGTAPSFQPAGLCRR